DSERLEHPSQLPERSALEVDAIAEGSQPRGAGRERLLVDVESDQPAAGSDRPENRFGVAAAADRAVHHPRAGTEGEHREALVEKDRPVIVGPGQPDSPAAPRRPSPPGEKGCLGAPGRERFAPPFAPRSLY